MDLKLLRSSIIIPWGGWWKQLPLPSKGILSQIFGGSENVSTLFDDKGFNAVLGDGEKDILELIVNHDGMDLTFTDIGIGYEVYRSIHDYFSGLNEANQAASGSRHLGFCLAASFEASHVAENAGSWLGGLLRPSLSYVEDKKVTASRIDVRFNLDPEQPFPCLNCLVEPRLGSVDSLFVHLSLANPQTDTWIPAEKVIEQHHDFVSTLGSYLFKRHFGLEGS